MSIISSNNYRTALSSGITNVATTMTVDSVARLAAIGGGVTTYLTLYGGGNIEIVLATSVSGNTITMTRAQQGTSAVAFSAGDIVSCRPTSDNIDRKADGASSSTDNAVPRFDGTTGKILQGSSVIVDDSQNMSGVGTLSTSGLATFNAGAAIKNGATGPGFIDVYEDSDNGSNKIQIIAPSSIASDKIATLLYMLQVVQM